MEQTTRPISPELKDWARNNWLSSLAILVVAMIILDNLFFIGSSIVFLLYLSFVLYLKYKKTDIYYYFKYKILINIFVFLFFLIRLLVDNADDTIPPLLTNKEYFIYLETTGKGGNEYKIIRSVPKESKLINCTVTVRGANREEMWVAGRFLENEIQSGLLVFSDWRKLKKNSSIFEEITLFINHSLPLNKAGNLARGIICGDRHAISADDRFLFQHAGTMHLFAVSGLHVGCLFLVFDLVGKCLSVSLGLRGIIALLACGFYVVLVDQPNSAIRAWLMLATFFFSISLNRKNFPLSSLCISAMIILAISPQDVFSTGFQLSFTIVAVILWSFRGFSKRDFRSAYRFYVATALILCLACSVGSSLIVIDYFKYFSGLSIISNILIYPIIFVFFSVSLCCVFISNNILVFFLDLVGSYIILVSSYFGTLNNQLFGNFQFPDIPNLVHFLFVCFFLFTFYAKFSFTKRFTFIAILYSLICFLCFHFT